MSDAKNVALSRQTAFTGVKKTTKATNAEFEELRKGLVNMSKEIPSTFEELSKISELG